MNSFSVRSALLALAVLIGSPGGPAVAGNNKISYVASVAQGSGNCSSPATACAEMFVAMNNTAVNGTVLCISGAADVGVGFEITQSITIDCSGSNYVAHAIAINAPGANVRLIGLTVDGDGIFGPLISIGGANSVVIENSRIGDTASFPATSCVFDHRLGPGKLLIRDTTISDCVSGVGILVAPNGGSTLTVALDRVSVFNSTYGLAVGSGGRVMIDHSTFSGNVTAGIEADSGAFIGVNDSMISSNNIGVQAGGTVSLSNSDIKSNNTAISGPTQSFGNNRFFANISDGTPPNAVAQH